MGLQKRGPSDAVLKAVDLKQSSTSDAGVFSSQSPVWLMRFGER